MLLNRHARKSFCRWNVESATAWAALRSCDQGLDITKTRNDAYTADSGSLPFIPLLIERRSTSVGRERDTILARYYFRTPSTVPEPCGSRSRGPLPPPAFRPRDHPWSVWGGIGEFWISRLGEPNPSIARGSLLVPCFVPSSSSFSSLFAKNSRILSDWEFCWAREWYDRLRILGWKDEKGTTLSSLYFLLNIVLERVLYEYACFSLD